MYQLIHRNHDFVNKQILFDNKKNKQKNKNSKYILYLKIIIVYSNRI